MATEMALQQAKQNFVNQREAGRNQPYEPTNDFDYMLTALLGDALEPSLEFLRRARAGETPDLPPLASLEKIQILWGELFPGRELRFHEYMPLVVIGCSCWLIRVFRRALMTSMFSSLDIWRERRDFPDPFGPMTTTGPLSSISTPSGRRTGLWVGWASAPGSTTLVIGLLS